MHVSRLKKREAVTIYAGLLQSSRRTLGEKPVHQRLARRAQQLRISGATEGLTGAHFQQFPAGNRCRNFFDSNPHEPVESASHLIKLIYLEIAAGKEDGFGLPWI